MRGTPGGKERLAPDQGVDRNHSCAASQRNVKAKDLRPLPPLEQCGFSSGLPQRIGLKGEGSPFIAASPALWDCAAQAGGLARPRGSRRDMRGGAFAKGWRFTAKNDGREIVSMKKMLALSLALAAAASVSACQTPQQQNALAGGALGAGAGALAWRCSHPRQRRRRVGGRRDRRGVGGDDRRRLDAAALPRHRTPARPTAAQATAARPPANARAGATTTTATASAWRTTEPTLIRRFTPPPGQGPGFITHP